MSTLLALVKSERWSRAVEDMARSNGSLVLRRDPAELTLAELRAATILVELAAFPDFRAAELGRGTDAPVLALVDDPAQAEAALARGASDCELVASPAQLAMRLRVLDATRARQRKLEDDASVLALLADSHETGWRFWEFDLERRAYVRLLPTAGSSRHHGIESLATLTWKGIYSEAAQAHLRSIVRDEIAHHAATGEIRTRTFDVEITNADGSTGFRRAATRLVLDEGGKPVMWRGITSDTTDAVHSRSALSTAQAAFDALVDALPLAVIPLDEQGRVLGWNRAAERMFGYAADEVVGRPYPLVKESDGSAAEYRGHLRDAFSRAEGLSDHHTVRFRKDGTPIDVAIWTRTMLGPDGTPNRAVAILADMTDRRRAAREIEQRDRALQEARRLEAIGQLAGGVAHDFNNLLMVIESCSDALAEQIAPDSGLDDEVVDLSSAVLRAKALVRQLLVFARRAPVAARAVDVATVVRPLVAMLRRLTGEDVEIAVTFDPSPCVVRAEPTQIEQILVNLVVNARDAIRGAGAIRIDVRPAARRSGVELSVSDTGTGMDEATRARIFEPFFTTKEPGQGTGLGLATVHGIVTGLGGEITVTSTPGVGSEFVVLLPRESELPSELEPNSGRTSRPLGSELVLLVEDDAAVRRILARELLRSGYRVLDVDDGASALELAASHSEPIDLLVTDIVMPRMSGDELARRLRAVHPDLEVLFMTGYNGRAAIERIVEGGEGPVLFKPFPPAMLLEQVRTLLRAGRRAADGSAVRAPSPARGESES